DQGVQLDGLTFDQQRLKGLHTESVEGGRTVEQHGVLFDDLVEDIPDDGDLVLFRQAGAWTWSFLFCDAVDFLCALDHPFGGFDRGAVTVLLQKVVNEGLVELEGHFLGQTTLVHAQAWTGNDDGTSRVVDAFSEQVLAEATAFTAQRFAQGFERTSTGSGDAFATSAVIEERIDR